MADIDTDGLIQELWKASSQRDSLLYAILDGARDPRIYASVLTSGCEHECLYTGELEADLRQTAPYLLRIDRDKPYLRQLIERGWGDNWGIFLRSTAPFKALRRHLRGFLMVYDPNIRPLYFRYYDPRVLRMYLPTCNAQELATVFGPIECFLLEDQTADALLSMRLRDDLLHPGRTALKPRSATARAASPPQASRSEPPRQEAPRAP